MRKESTDTYPAVAPAASSASRLATSLSIEPHRGLTVIDVARIPSPPDRFRGHNGAPRVPESRRDAVHEALAEVASVGPALARELGPYVPEPRQGQLILRRLESIRSGKKKVLALLAYFDEMEDQAAADALAFLLPVRREVQMRAVHEPLIMRRFPSLLATEEPPHAPSVVDKDDAA